MAPKSKPFVKWVGGKTQLINQLEKMLPNNFSSWQNVTYIEPFVGGGAMLFHVLNNYSNIEHAVINDINSDLITCYQTVKSKPKELIDSLRDIEKEYYQLDIEKQKQFFLQKRAIYNAKNLDDITNTTLFFFLNKTCFNGLYRVNKSGLFNVPFGRYNNPKICDRDTILADSALLQKVEIICGDFENTFAYINDNTLFYFDPPYRPLSNTSNFRDYSKETFNDETQKRLKIYCDKIVDAGCSFMLSNSDGKNNGDRNDFFDKLYEQYYIERVLASRSINSNASKRGKLTEILVHNF